MTDNSASRPAIAADLRRRVLVEAGHRCAIPTCRHIEVDVHHIVPWAQAKAHRYDNLIALCPNCHRRADGGQIDRKSLRLYKFNLRFAHDKFSQLEIDMLFELTREPGIGVLWPAYLMLLVKRLVEAGYVRVITSRASVSIGAFQLSPCTLLITESGQDFVSDLGLREL